MSPAESQTFSRFGGLWIDRLDWQAVLDSKVASGRFSPAMGDRMRQFGQDGYTVFEAAVPTSTTAALKAELDAFWRHPHPDARIETFDNGPMEMRQLELRYRPGTTKLFHYHAFSALARQAIAAPAVVDFLTGLFDSQPKAFQSLVFWNGSQQPIHKDTAFVEIDGAPMEIAASWLALEDVSEGVGGLEYLVGSHRAPDFLFGGKHKWLSGAPHDHDAFLASLKQDATTYSQRQETFLAKEGDVLVWHADLAHGGGPITQPGRTRQSLVTHFTPAHRTPPYQRHAHRDAYAERGVQFIAESRQIQA